MNANNHDIKDEVVVSRDENSLALEFVIPASCDVFDITENDDGKGTKFIIRIPVNV